MESEGLAGRECLEEQIAVVAAAAENKAGYRIAFANIDNVVFVAAVAVAAAAGVVVKSARHN